MRAPALHLIGNAHLDPVWLWPWQEGFQEAKATLRSALDRLREYPDFVFTSSSAAIYAWIEENAPDMFAEIQQAVREGRWIIVGGWWIQPDCNLPSGESFVRQALHGQRYFREKFGVTAAVGYNVDSFGHAATLPQILKKSGCHAYVFMRPEPHEMVHPGRTFRWRSSDGSEVLAYQIPFQYQTFDVGIMETQVRRHAVELQESGRPLMCFYGVGNHGGGPTKAMLDHLGKLRDEPGFAPMVFSSPNRFFKEIAASGAQLPLVTTELQHHASGCYAAHSGVKRWNRRAENQLLVAEKCSTLAAWPGAPVHRAELHRAWRQVLFNQFHDILAGTSLESAYDDARDTYGEALAVAARATNHGLQTFSWQIDLPAEPAMKPLVVFNPHPWRVRTTVEFEAAQADLTGGRTVDLPPRDSVGGLPPAGVMRDHVGRFVPLQEIASVVVTRDRHRLAFHADLPPLGYRVYRLYAGTKPKRVATTVHATRTTLENRWLRVRFDRRTGALVELRDKRTGLNLVAGPAAWPQIVDDASDTWSHGVTCYARAFRPARLVEMVVQENGPVRAALSVVSAFGRSEIVQEFRLGVHACHLEVKFAVDWHEQHALLKLAFPVAVDAPVATHEIPYGHIERPANGEEEPFQSWVDVSGRARAGRQRGGLTLVNDTKGSVDVLEGTIRLTVLRSPIYAHHEPIKPRAGERHSYMDQGHQSFSYALHPHAGRLAPGDACRVGLEMNQPCIAQWETYHAGSRPLRASFVAVEPANIALTVLKPAEAGAGIVIRAYETAGRRTKARIKLSFCDREVTAVFGPGEIKTFLVPVETDVPIVETNLLEDAVPGPNC